MKLLRVLGLCSFFTVILATSLSAGVAFPDPPGGWTYIYHGDLDTAGEAGSGFTSLDGTWSHDNGSDEWDGSGLAGTFGDGNRPGGAESFTESGVTYLRFQDTGDPRDFGYSDPGSNRKVYLGHSMTDLGASDTVLDDGVTLSFRARIPVPSKTTHPLDPLHRDGQQAAGVQPYPATGDGYVTSDGGKGNFVIKQNAGGAIAFSLTTTNDTAGGNPNANRANFAGLTMNEFNGNQITGQVNFGQGTATNVVPFDPTEWHEFWIVLRSDPAGIGTHQGFVYLDGSLQPIVFRITAGTGSDYSGISYLAIGMTATPQNAALDIDFVAYKVAAEFPPGAFDNLPPEITDLVPPAGTLFHPAANGISFNASTGSTNGIPTTGIRLTLNGADVSANVMVTGTAQSRSARYSGLISNAVYNGQLVVSDQAGRSSTNRIAFDTFVEATSIVIEAEDYNFSNGQFLDDATPGSYDSQVGTPEIDYHDTGTAFATVYRFDMLGLQVTTDVARQKFIDFAVTDYQIFQLQPGEWLNYTRTFRATNYNVYLRAAATAAQSFRLDRVGGDPTTASQTTTAVGSFVVPAGGPNSFSYIPLTDASGGAVSLALSGVQTFRVTALGANNNASFNFLAFIPGSPAAAQIRVTGARMAGGNFSFSFNTVGGASYTVEHKSAVSDAAWTSLQTVAGTGNPATVTDNGAGSMSQRLYRVRSP